jgi:hypothetical protein
MRDLGRDSWLREVDVLRVDVVVSYMHRLCVDWNIQCRHHVKAQTTGSSKKETLHPCFMFARKIVNLYTLALIIQIQHHYVTDLWHAIASTKCR